MAHASGHSQFVLLAQRHFAPFFATQLLGAFNDNVFRNATIVLIVSQLGLSTSQASLYTNLAPALFILPFFLFSALAGQDRRLGWFHQPSCLSGIAGLMEPTQPTSSRH